MKLTAKTSFIAGAVLILLFSCATGGKAEFPQWRMTSFSVFDGQDNLLQSLAISYNSEDKPAEIVTSDADGNEISRKAMSYSESGKMVLLENISNDGSLVKSEYSYDGDDFLISVVTTKGDGDMLATASYINDERGNPVEWTSKYGRSSQSVHFQAEYDDQDRITKTTELDSQGNPIYYSISEYDEAGNELSYTIYSPEGIIDQKLENTYRENALLQSDIVDDGGNVLYSTVYELNDSLLPERVSNFNQYGDKSDYTDFLYNEEGLESEIRSYDYDGNLRERTVKEYDEAGNNIVVTIYGASGQILSFTRSTYENELLRMKEEEFSSLVFKLR